MERLAIRKDCRDIVYTFGRQIFEQNLFIHLSWVSAAKLLLFHSSHNRLKVAFSIKCFFAKYLLFSYLLLLLSLLQEQGKYNMKTNIEATMISGILEELKSPLFIGISKDFKTH